MEEIYWITRLDSIRCFFITLTVLCSVIGTVLFLSFIITSDFEPVSKVVKKWVIILMIAAIPFIMGAIFIPTTKDMLMIYGVGGTIEYLKDNETAKQLPDKSIEALDKLLDEYLNETE